MALTFEWPRSFSGVKSSRFYLKSMSINNVSPWTGGRSVYGVQTQVWVAELTLRPFDEAEWRELSAFISRLDGTSNNVRMFDPMRKSPRGVAGGAVASSASSTPTGEPWSDGTYWSDGSGWVAPSGFFADSFGWSEGSWFGVAGENAARGVSTLLLGGLVASQALALAGGDLFTVGGFLYEVCADAASDASGYARVEIRPRLRASVASGDQVSFYCPAATFKLASDDQGVFDRRGVERVGDLGINLVEVLP